MTSSEQTKSGKIARNTLFLYGQMFVQMIVALLTARMLFNALGVVDYGIYNVIGGVVLVFSVLNNVEGATIRFLTYDIGRDGSREEVHLMFSTAQTVHMVIALIVLLLAETAGLYYVFHELVIPPERLQSTLVVYQFSIVTAMLSIISIPYSALLIAHEKMGAFASFGIIQTFVGVGIVLIVKYANTDKLILYGALVMLMQVSVRIAYGLYCRRHFAEVAGKWCFDKKLFIRMLKFAGWTFNGTVAYMAYTEGVNLLLNAFFGPVMNAARGIANTIRMKVESFAGNFQGAVNPQIVKSYAQQDLPYLHKLIITSSRFSLLMIFMLSLPIVLETDTILHLWLGKVPEYTVDFTRLALFSVMVETLGRILIMAIQATGKIAKFQMVEANILLLIVPVAYVCLKAGCSPVAVYLTQFFVFIIAHAARIMIVCPAIGMKGWTYIRDVIGRSVVCMGVAALPPTLLFYMTQDTTHVFWRLAAIVTISLLSSGVSIFYIGCDTSMRTFIVDKIKTKISHG
jgi:O-antigen/teichoic acid export membrane protein